MRLFNAKNNNGMTLVELLISMAVIAILMAQISVLLYHTSNLFVRGVKEVNLQRESQQLIQQLEELMVDADVEVSAVYDPSISSDTITIKTHEVVDGVSTNKVLEYEIKLTKDPADAYGVVTLSKKEDGIVVATDIPMAENVNSISYNMGTYAVDSKISISANMMSDYKTYCASQDVYLRNDIGISSGGKKGGSTASYEYEIVLKRYEEVNLKDFIEENGVDGYDSCTFEFEDPDGADDYYVASNVVSSKTLECTPTYLANKDEAAGPYIINVMNGGSLVTTIGVRTDAIKIGVGEVGKEKGFGFCNFLTTNQDPLKSFIPVYGIDLTKATDVKVKLKQYDGSSFSDVPSTSEITSTGKEMNNAYYGTNESLPDVNANNESGNKWKYSGGMSICGVNIQPDAFWAYTDKLSNSCVVCGKNMTYSDAYLALISEGKIFLMQIDYKIGSHTISIRSVAVPNTYSEDKWGNVKVGGSSVNNALSIDGVTYKSIYTYVNKRVKPASY